MTQSKLEPICRALAGFGWLCEVELMQQEGEEILTREEYIDQCWTSYLTEARAVVQALLDMADRPPVHLMASYAQSWLRFLLDEEKSLSQKMHESGFTPRKQGKTVREDE